MSDIVFSQLTEDVEEIERMLIDEPVRLKILIRSLVASEDAGAIVGARLIVWYLAEQLALVAKVTGVDEADNEITGDSWVTYSLERISDRPALARRIEEWVPALDEWTDDDGLANVTLFDEAEEWLESGGHASTEFGWLRDAFECEAADDA